MKIAARNVCPALAVGLVLVLLTGAAPATRAQSLEAANTPLSAWLDLRPAAPGAEPQTVPNWVESFDFVAQQPAAVEEKTARLQFRVDGEAIASNPAKTQAEDTGTNDSPRSIFRIHLGHPAEATQDLQVRVFFEDRATGPRPRVTAWDELGREVSRSRFLGQHLGLASSQTVTVSMVGVNYLEIEAGEDGTQVRSVFLTWLKQVQMHEPMDFASSSTDREPFHILSSTKQHSQGDSYLYGVVTASLQKKPLVLSGATSAVATFEFPLDHAPMVAVITYQVLGADIASPLLVRVNGHEAEASTYYLPDLADPAYQGRARDSDPALSFHYTGWLRAQKVVAGELLTPGLNNVALELSNGKDTVAVRSVEVQLKYNWDKFDYVLTPGAPPSSP